MLSLSGLYKPVLLFEAEALASKLAGFETQAAFEQAFSGEKGGLLRLAKACK